MKAFEHCLQCKLFLNYYCNSFKIVEHFAIESLSHSFQLNKSSEEIEKKEPKMQEVAPSSNFSKKQEAHRERSKNSDKRWCKNILIQFWIGRFFMKRIAIALFLSAGRKMADY